MAVRNTSGYRIRRPESCEGKECMGSPAMHPPRTSRRAAVFTSPCRRIVACVANYHQEPKKHRPEYMQPTNTPIVSVPEAALDEVTFATFSRNKRACGSIPIASLWDHRHRSGAQQESDEHSVKTSVSRPSSTGRSACVQRDSITQRAHNSIRAPLQRGVHAHCRGSPNPPCRDHFHGGHPPVTQIETSSVKRVDIFQPSTEPNIHRARFPSWVIPRVDVPPLTWYHALDISAWCAQSAVGHARREQCLRCRARPQELRRMSTQSVHVAYTPDTAEVPDP